MSLARLFESVRTLLLVTGTNGKSTTAHLIEQILARAGKLPLRNRDGANLVPGITATLSSAAFLPRRQVVLEVDEGSLPMVVPPARPSVLVVTNVFRDQLARYGEVDAVAERIRQAVAATPEDCVIVANADDPTVADIGLRSGRRTTFFGLDVAGAHAPRPSADAVFCPGCDRPLGFARTFLSHLGHYACAPCGFSRPVPQVAAAAAVSGGMGGVSFRVGNRDVTCALVGVHAIYNALAAIAAVQVLGIPETVSFEALRTARPMPGRSEWITHKGRRVFFALVKNPAGFEALAGVLKDVPGPRQVLLLLNDRRADSGDVSWIWDAEFEIFRGDRVWVGGRRAEALALRLKYADVERVPGLVRHHGHAFEAALAGTTADAPLWVLMNYSSMLDLFGFLNKRLTPA
jgi:UDP-N-acetylmuramyl tripeptide synthase